MAVGLTVAEVALALFLAWMLVRSDFGRHASRSARLDSGGAFVLAAMVACLAIFVFVLVYWQWRLSGRARVRVLLAVYLSLVFSFCGFCWLDVSVGTAVASGGGQAAPSARHLVEQTAAMGVAIGALLAGLAAVTVVLRLDRRSGFLKRRG